MRRLPDALEHPRQPIRIPWKVVEMALLLGIVLVLVLGGVIP